MVANDQFTLIYKSEARKPKFETVRQAHHPEPNRNANSKFELDIEVDLAYFIAVVKKTFRYSNVFLLQPLIPAFRISELIFEKRYNNCLYSILA